MGKYKETFLFAILIIIIIVAVFINTKPKAGEFFGVQKDFAAKKIELADLQRKLETLKATETEKSIELAGQVKKIYKPEFSGMEAESAFTVLFDDIIEMAKYNAVKIYSIEYVYNPASDEFVVGAPTSFNVCQLNMQVIGDYSDMESFLKELYKYPYLMNMDKLEFAPYEKNKIILLGNIQLKLYASK